MSIFGHLVHVEEIWLIFVYEGRWVKINVVGAKKAKILIAAM